MRAPDLPLTRGALPCMMMHQPASCGPQQGPSRQILQPPFRQQQHGGSASPRVLVMNKSMGALPVGTFSPPPTRTSQPQQSPSRTSPRAVSGTLSPRPAAPAFAFKSEGTSSVHVAVSSSSSWSLQAPSRTALLPQGRIQLSAPESSTVCSEKVTRMHQGVLDVANVLEALEAERAAWKLRLIHEKRTLLRTCLDPSSSGLLRDIFNEWHTVAIEDAKVREVDGANTLRYASREAYENRIMDLKQAIALQRHSFETQLECVLHTVVQSERDAQALEQRVESAEGLLKSIKDLTEDYPKDNVDTATVGSGLADIRTSLDQVLSELNSPVERWKSWRMAPAGSAILRYGEGLPPELIDDPEGKANNDRR